MLTWIAFLGLGAGQFDRISVPDVHGKTHQPLTIKSRCFASALVFITNDCPIANAYAPEIKRIIGAYRRRGVDFYLVHVAPDMTPAKAARHAREYGYDVPVLLDTGQKLVKAAGATVTPEAAVFVGSNLQYRGRIDDQYYKLGSRRAKVTSRDLRKALEAVLQQRKPAPDRTAAVGCLIPRKE